MSASVEEVGRLGSVELASMTVPLRSVLLPQLKVAPLSDMSAVCACMCVFLFLWDRFFFLEQTHHLEQTVSSLRQNAKDAHCFCAVVLGTVLAVFVFVLTRPESA
jgi:hypothetical protein